MPLVEVLGDVPRDGRFARLKHLQISVPLPGRDFVTDVQQLAEVGIELLAPLIVTQRADILVSRPSANLFLAGQFGRIDVDDRAIGRAQLGPVIERLAINFLGKIQPVASGLGQPDQFLQPGRAGGLEVKSRIEPGQRPPDWFVD